MTDEGTWWTRGTALAERLTPGRPLPHPSPAPRDDGAGAPDDPLDGWRADYPSAEAFRARLEARGLDEDALRGLFTEPAGALAARIERPSWAATAERAWTAAPQDAPPPAPGVSWQDGFAAVLGPFVDNAAGDLLASPGAAGAGAVADLTAVRRCFTGHLAALLVALARRTLVLELNVARVEGRLTGATPHERFTDFVRHCSSATGLRALLTGFPVLARLLGQACEQSVETWSQLLERYAADRAAVVDAFFGGTDPGPLTEVSSGVGDRHGRGRSVAVLRFSGGGRVVLKPRPVSVHAHFNDTVAWLNSRLPGLGLRTLQVLDRPGYGWVEYAEAMPCTDRAQVGRFYRRVGALLALLHALGGTDMHVENLIACADQPVPVDLETLLHPVPARPAAGDPARAALEASVRRTALLPFFLVGERGAVDLSGLGGDRDATLPGEVPGWAAPATDEMRLIRTTGVFPGAANRPRLSGTDTDPGKHTEDLVTGFRAGYDTITVHHDDLTGPDGLLARFAGDGTRAVVRNTRWYATLLDESTHPDVLRDALERDRLLDVLWRESSADPVLRALVPAELDDLWAGDVPLVSCRPASPDLTVGRFTLRGLTTRPGLPAARDRLSAMGGADRQDQEWIIRACLATRRAPAPATATGLPAHPGTGARAGHGAAAGALGAGAPVVADAERLLAAACGVADRVVASAHEAGGRVNWLGVEPLDGRVWAVLPQGAGLPHGYCGTALFLAELGDLTGTGRYSSLARRAVAPVPALLAALAERPSELPAVGAGFAGLGGIAYALCRLAVLLGDDRIAEWTADAVELTAAAAGPAGEPGVLEGDAGCLAAMLAVRQTTGSARAEAVARACADRLAARAADTLPAGGFDTGASGVGWALLRFAAESGGSPRHAAAGLAALDSACARYGTAPIGTGWCDGPSGVALAMADVSGASCAAGGPGRAASTAVGPGPHGSAAAALRPASVPGTAGARTARPAPYPAATPVAHPAAHPAVTGPLCTASPGTGLLGGDPADAGPAGCPDALLERVAASAAARPAAGDHSLCHGETGVLDLLLTAAGAGRSPAGADGALHRRAEALLAALDRFGPRCGTPDSVSSPGLLTGLAGIGHGLLRLGFGARVPSVLLLRSCTQARSGGPPAW